MLRLLGFLRDTIERGASPRSVLGQQRLPAADRRGDRGRRRDVSRRQLAVEGSGERAAPAEFAKWDIAPIPQADAATRSTGTGGWVWVVFARDPARQRAAIEFIRTVEAPANAARISEATGHLPVRRSVYRDFPIFSQDRWYRRFGDMLVDGHARPTVADLPGDFPAAPARDRRRRVGREDAGRGARRCLGGRQRRVRAPVEPRTRGTGPRLDRDCVAADRGARYCCRWRCSGTDCADRRTRTLDRGWVLPAVALVDAHPVYPMLDLMRLSFTDSTVAGTRLHATRSAAIATCSATRSFYGMVGVTVDLRRQLGRAAAGDRLRRSPG